MEPWQRAAQGERGCRRKGCSRQPEPPRESSPISMELTALAQVTPCPSCTFSVLAIWVFRVKMLHVV